MGSCHFVVWVDWWVSVVPSFTSFFRVCCLFPGLGPASWLHCSFLGTLFPGHRLVGSGASSCAVGRTRPRNFLFSALFLFSLRAFLLSSPDAPALAVSSRVSSFRRFSSQGDPLPSIPRTLVPSPSFNDTADAKELFMSTM